MRKNRVALRALVVALGATACFTGASYWMTSPASANHPVLVEGEKDFDGDGRTGVAEDGDSATDRVFGTISAALGGDNGGANQNGAVIIVTSGRFPENLTITATNGNVTLEAADGVYADIDAVVAGQPGNADRQATVGVNVDVADGNRVVLLRNLTIRNFAEGVRAGGNARVLLRNVRLDSNVGVGIRALGNAKVTISDCFVLGSGLRFAPGIDNTPRPGAGISFEEFSSGWISNTVVTGSAGTGIANFTRSAVRVVNSTLADNRLNTSGIVDSDQPY
jgi:hypothetical protein